MSRLSRQDYHGYPQQTHPRWSPSPPLNRLSAAMDLRLAPRLSNAAQQELQPSSQTPQLASSQIAPPSSIPSNVEVVQAVNAMSAQVTNQLSVMGTQLTSLVSLTSRLIEISQMQLAATDTAGRATSAAPGSGVPGQPLGSQALRPDASPANSNLDLNRARVNGIQNSSSFPNNNLSTATASNTGRPDTRQGQFYQNPQQQQPDASQDANDLLRSRLPSPVFPDDPMDMSAEVSTSGHQTPAQLKRLSTAGQGANDSARKAANPEASLGDWKGWLNRTWHPPPGHQSRSIKYQTMQQARRAHRDQTKRSMATLGRLPLKEFLEIRPEQYLSVRKTGRKLYQEWLLQEVRLAKQPEDRVKAAINRLENDHPELGDCEDHWKARQLLQQIIDNAIDEANLHRKKEARASNAHQEPSESTPRGMENARSTSMLGMSASSSSSALADADRSLRGADMSARKGSTTGGAGANKGTKGGVQRRKADQAELDDTPTRKVHCRLLD
ncbi:hypothetical protein NDA16_000739 [Ustilago loliicola]|nr:hypothetical protein NDA16_000739 [Ustilago loliicola]